MSKTNRSVVDERTTLERKALSGPYDTSFLAELRSYITSKRESLIGGLSYKTASGGVANFPALLSIGTICYREGTEDPFYTCCRYALIREAVKEKEGAMVVIEEVLDRVCKALEIWESIPPEKRLASERALGKFQHFALILGLGLSMLRDMEEIAHGNFKEENFDAENLTALKWRAFQEENKISTLGRTWTGEALAF